MSEIERGGSSGGGGIVTSKSDSEGLIHTIEV